MDARWGWALATLAVAVGYAQWRWQGLAVALTLVVFWLLLQFSRSLRVLKNAGAAPVGTVANAVMLHARLASGMSLLQVLPITGSLGSKLSDDPETFAWRDAAGDAVEAQFKAGRLSEWRLLRAV